MRTHGRGASSVVVICLLLNLSVVILLYGLVHQSSDFDHPLDSIEDDEDINPDVNVNLEDDQVILDAYDIQIDESRESLIRDMGDLRTSGNPFGTSSFMA
jgi:hypothetical protein